MDTCLNPVVEKVVIMSSAQVGKTEILNNIAGYYIQHEPSPILVVQPTLEMAEAWSKDRLAPMIRDSKCFTGLIKDPRSRDSGNTLLHKKYPGGYIVMAGANSPASLAMRSIRVLLCDEIDRYPVSAGTEGDPISLAEKRTQNFWNRKEFLCSTPTIKGASRIEMVWEQSDKRRYNVPCPHCHEHQVLKWAQVKWDKGAPEAAYYACEHCGAIITDGDKQWMLANGKWVAELPFRGIAGFHLSELYSPWVRFGQMAVGFLRAKDNKETLKAWTNTSLGEPFEDGGEELDLDSLMNRKENWGAEAPEDVLVVTCGVDVQNDRIELELKGWGVGEESWSLDYVTFFGDPAQDEIWNRLDGFLKTPIPHKSGLELNVSMTFIDSGGSHTQRVYEFCKDKAHLNIFPIKGSSVAGKPIVSRPSNKNRFKVWLFNLGVDTAKELLFSRLKITDVGYGYCHFPADRTKSYFEQLTAEKLITRFEKGVARREWKKIRTRNEALDCNVYALAALKTLNPDLNRLRTEMDAHLNIPDEPEAPAPSQINKPAQSWIPKKSNWLAK